MNPNLIFQQLYEAESSTYTYLLADAQSKEAVLIDSVIEMVDRDLKLISELGLKLVTVLDTHIHADHVTGAGEIRSRLGTQTAVPENAKVACADRHLKENDKVSFGPFSIQVLETPGHTDASLSFVCEGMVFTGDALLIRGTGRTDFQSGSAEELYESVTKKLFTLPEETIVYPAHDYKGFTSSTIGMEKKHNPRLGGGKTKEEFVKIMASLKLPNPKKIHEALPANEACGTVRADRPQSNSMDQEKIMRAMSAEALRERLDKTLVVDVRTPEEFNGELGHIPGAHHITLGEDLKHFLEGYDQTEEIVFVCGSGNRSGQARSIGESLGYSKIAHLEGGMQRWKEIGFPVER